MNQSYLFFTFILSVFVSQVNAQKVSETWEHEIEVISSTEKFDGVDHYAYSTFVYEAEQGDVHKLVLDEVTASAKSKVRKKGVIAALEVDIPHIGKDPITVKAMAQSVLAKNAIKVSMAFFHDSLEINPSDFPESDKAAQEVVHELGVMFNKSVVASQIADVEKQIAASTKKYESLKKDKAGYEKQILNGELKQSELDAHLVKLNAKLLDKQQKAERAAVLSDGASADSKDAKKNAKAKKNVMKAEREILKTEQSKLKAQQGIDQATKALPIKEQEIAEHDPKLAELKELLAKLNVKHDSIK